MTPSPTSRRDKLLRLLRLPSSCTRSTDDLQLLFGQAKQQPCRTCQQPKSICGGTATTIAEDLASVFDLKLP